MHSKVPSTSFPVAGSTWTARTNFASPVPYSCFVIAASRETTESFM